MNICITGISRGIGQALCRELIHRGHDVWGVARSIEPLARLAEELNSEAFTWSKVDVSSESDVAAWHADTVERCYDVDALILNASIQLDDMTYSGYDHALGRAVLRTNLEGNLACIAAFLPAFLKRRSGIILGICSTVALRPSVRSASYAASKAGLAMALRTLAFQCRPSGVRCKTVFLGPIVTEMWEGKRNFLTPTAQQAAEAIARFLPARKATLFYPRLSTSLLRLSLFLPDRAFAAISGTVMK